MANSDKDIRIVTNRNKSALPNISFTGYNNDPIVLNVLDDNTVSFEGSSGQLFSISNAVTSGTIFSVNDITGIPSFRVDADGTVGIAEFLGNVGIGITNPSYKFHARGDSYFSSTGNTALLLLSGTGGTIIASNSVNITLTDPARKGLVIRAATSQSANLLEWFPPSLPDGGYIRPTGEMVIGNAGTKNMSNGTNALLAIQGRGYTEGMLIRGFNSIASEVLFEVQNNGGAQLFGIYGDGGVNAPRINVTNGTASTSTTTGALIVTGGVGIGGTTNFGRDVRIFSSLASSSPFTGSLVVSGGVGISNNLFVGGGVAFTSSIASTSTATGALVVTGGVGIGGSVFTSTSNASSISGVVLNNGSVTLTGTYTQSNSSTTAFQVRDGSNNPAFVIDTIGDVISLPVAVASTSTSSGSLVVAGGVGIGGTLNVNDVNVVSRLTSFASFGSTGGLSWASATVPANYTEPFNSIVYGNGKFAAIGNTAVLISTDAINWEVKNISWPVTPTSPSIYFLNAKFIIKAGNSSYIAYSDDAVTWQTTTTAVSSGTMVYNKGLYYKYSGSNVGISTNLTNWTTQTTNGYAYRILNGYFYNNAQRSIDGINFESLVFPGTAPTDINYGNGIYFGAVYNSSIYYTSTDGLNFTQSTIEYNVYLGAEYYNGVYYLRCQHNIPKLYYSLDGYNYSSVNLFFNQYNLSMAFGNNKIVYIGYNPSQVNFLAYSDATSGVVDLNTKFEGSIDNVVIGRKNARSASFLDVGVSGKIVSNNTASSSTFSNNSAVFAGGVGIGQTLTVAGSVNVSNSLNLVNTTTGIATTWTRTVVGTGATISYLAYANNLYVGVGYSSLTSTDGVNWTTRTLPNNLSSVAFGNGIWSGLLGGTALGATSTNGTTWTSFAMTNSRNWTVMAFGNGKFVTLGSNSSVAAYSTNGFNWTEVTLPVSGIWVWLTYGGGYFVAVANASTTAVYSSDGINWTTTTLPSAAGWNCVTYGNGYFYVTGSSRFGVYSKDLINWTSYSTTIDGTAFVTYNNGSFVVADVNGATRTNIITGDFTSRTQIDLPGPQIPTALVAGDRVFIAGYGQTFYTFPIPNNSITLSPNTTGEINNVEIGNTKPASGAFSNIFSQGLVAIGATARSISPYTGALVVAGGVGIGGSLFVGNTLSIASSTASTSSLSGALIVSGGVGISGNVNANGIIRSGQLSAPVFTISALGGTGALTPSTIYYYKLSALDYFGNESLPSNEVSISLNSSTYAVYLSPSVDYSVHKYKVFRTTTSGIYTTSLVDTFMNFKGYYNASYLGSVYVDRGKPVSAGSPLTTATANKVYLGSTDKSSLGSLNLSGQLFIQNPNASVPDSRVGIQLGQFDIGAVRDGSVQYVQSFTSATGGTLTAGTNYYYKYTTIDYYGNESLPSKEYAYTADSNGAVQINLGGGDQSVLKHRWYRTTTPGNFTNSYIGELPGYIDINYPTSNVSPPTTSTAYSYYLNSSTIDGTSYIRRLDTASGVRQLANNAYIFISGITTSGIAGTLAPNTTYYYKIAGFDRLGNLSSSSSPYPINTGPATSVQITSNGVTWINGEDGFVVWRSTSKDNFSNAPAFYVQPGAAYTDTGNYEFIGTPPTSSNFVIGDFGGYNYAFAPFYFRQIDLGASLNNTSLRVLSAPARLPEIALVSGGTLTPGAVYYYKVMGFTNGGAHGMASASVRVVVGAGGAVRLTFYVGITSAYRYYNVYRTQDLTNWTNSLVGYYISEYNFTDIGYSGTAGSPVGYGGAKTAADTILSGGSLYTQDITTSRFRQEISAPSINSITGTTGGILTTSTTYYYRIAAIGNGSVEYGQFSKEFTYTTSDSQNAISLAWGRIPGASAYVLIRSTNRNAAAGSTSIYVNDLSFVDYGYSTRVHYYDPYGAYYPGSYGARFDADGRYQLPSLQVFNGTDPNLSVNLLPPVISSAVAGTGGTLANNTNFYYLVEAYDYTNQKTMASTEIVVNTGANNAVTLTWNEKNGAFYYKVYRSSTSNFENCQINQQVYGRTFTDINYPVINQSPMYGPGSASMYRFGTQHSIGSYFGLLSRSVIQTTPTNQAVYATDYALRLAGRPANTIYGSLFELGDFQVSGYNGSINGTYFGLSSATGFTGNFIDLQSSSVSRFKVDYLGSATIGSTTGSGSTSSGALVISGGVGIGQSLFTSTSYSSSISGAIFSNGSATLPGTFTQNNSSTTAFQVRDGSNNPTFVIDTIADIVSLPVSVASTSTGTGSLVVSGGVGIGGSLYSGSVLTAGRLQNQSFSGTAIGATTNPSVGFGVGHDKTSYGNGVFVSTSSWGAYNANYSTDGVNWTAVSLPVNQAYPVNFYGNGYFVLGGLASTTVLYSTNGQSWSQVSIGNTLSRSNGVYGNGKYVMVGTGATYFYSSNVTSWTANTLPYTADWRIAYGNGMFVALAYGNGTIIYSYDAINWSISNTVSNSHTDLYYGNGKFVVTTWSGWGVKYSTDGINWFSVSNPGGSYDGNLLTVRYGNGVYAISDYGQTILSSTDGITWDPGVYKGGGSSYISYGNNRFAGGRWIDGPTNTVTLDPKFTGEINNVRIGALTPASGDFTNLSSTGSANLVGTVNANNLNILSKINQTPVLGGFAGTDGWASSGVLTGTNNNYALAFGNGLFVQVRKATNYTSFSSDGKRWIASTMPFSGDWIDIAWGKDKFVAIASAGATGAYSGNGITWTSMNMPTNTSGWYALTYGDEKFVAVGNGATVAYSSDGISWTGSAIASTNWTGIAYGNGTFVAVSGNGSSGAYSYDGLNWNYSTIGGVNNGIKFITYGNGYFIVTNYVSTAINYSRDGINWSTSTRTSTFSIHTDLAYGNGVYTTFNYQEASYSYDAINWLNGNTINATDWQAVAYGNNRFVATSINTNLVGSIDGPSNTLNLHPKFTGDIDNVRIGSREPAAAEFTNLAAQQPVRFTANTNSIDSTSGALVVVGGVGIGGTVYQRGSFNSGSLTAPALFTIGGTGLTGTLTPSTIYYYVVTAVDFDGRESLPSVQFSANTNTSTSMLLGWFRTPGAKQYRVYRSAVSGNFVNCLIRTTKYDNFNYFYDYGFPTTTGTPPTTTQAFTNKISFDTSYTSSTGNILHGVNIPSGSLSVNTKNDSPLTAVEIHGDAAFTRLMPGTQVAASTGGTLSAGTVYYYRHSFVDLRGNESLASDPVSFLATAGGAINVSWAIEQAQFQVGRIYRSTNIDVWTNTLIAETSANGFLDLNYPQLNSSPITTSSSHSNAYISGLANGISSLTNLYMSAGRTNFRRVNGVPTVVASTSTSAGTLLTNTTYYYKAVYLDHLGGVSRFGPEIAINSGLGTAINFSFGVASNQGVYLYRSTSPNFTSGSRFFTTGNITDDGSISNSTSINSSPLSGLSWNLGVSGNLLPFNLNVSSPSNGFGLGVLADTPIVSNILNGSLAGTLTTGTRYYYRVVAYDAFGQATSASQISSAVAPAIGSIYLAIGYARNGFASFDVYRSTDPNNFSNTYIGNFRNNAFIDLGYATSSGSPREGANGAKDIYLRGVNDYSVHASSNVISAGFVVRSSVPVINTAYSVATSGLLSNNTDYYYKIRVHFWANNTYGEVSDPFKVNTGSNSAVYLQWTAVEGAQHYTLYRSTDPKNFTNAIMINGIKDNFAYDFGHAVATETPFINYNGSNNVIADVFGTRLSSLRIMGDNQKLVSLFDAPKFSTYPSATTGGTLANNTVFFYTVVARGYTNVRSLSSSEIRVNTASNNAVSLNWLNVNGATGYDIYRSTAINSWSNTLIASNVQSTTFIDINYPTTTGTPDRLNTYGVGVAQSLFENNYNILARTIFGAVNNVDSNYQNFTVRINGNIFRNSSASTLQVGTGFTNGYTFNGSSEGTELAIASGTGFTGSLFDAHSSGVSRFRINNLGNTTIGSTTGSGSTSTGALVISGGVGIGQSLFTSPSYSSSISGAIFSNGSVTLSGTFTQNNSSTTAFQVRDGSNNPAFVIDTIGDIISLPVAVASTSTGTGSLVVAGGVGIGGSINIGGRVGIGTNLLDATLNIRTSTASTPGIVIQGSTSQSASLFSVNSSVGGSFFEITNSGIVNIKTSTAGDFNSVPLQRWYGDGNSIVGVFQKGGFLYTGYGLGYVDGAGSQTLVHQWVPNGSYYITNWSKRMANGTQIMFSSSAGGDVRIYGDTNGSLTFQSYGTYTNNTMVKLMDPSPGTNQALLGIVTPGGGNTRSQLFSYGNLALNMTVAGQAGTDWDATNLFRANVNTKTKYLGNLAVLAVDDTNRFVVGPYGNTTVSLGGTTASTGFIIKAASSQTGNLFEAQSSTGATLTFIDASGNASVGGTLNISGNASIGGTLNVSGSNSYFQNNLYVGNNTQGRLYFSQATLGSAGTTVIPTMAFIGATNSPITLSVLPDNSLSFDGSSGQLFSINNNLSTGWIFSINDISGLPIFRTNADLTVAMGEYGGNVGIGLSNPTFKLQVSGNAGISGTTLISNTTTSTNSTSGALVVSGGVGIGGSLNVTSASTISGVTINSGVITGSLTGTATTATYANQSGYATTAGLATTARNIDVVATTSSDLHLITFSPVNGGSGVGLSTTSLIYVQPDIGFLSASYLDALQVDGIYSNITYFSGTAVTANDFYGPLSGTATTATNVNIVSASTNASHPVLFTPATGTASGAALSTESTFVYNPSTDILSVSGLAITSGTASTSTSTGALRVTGGVGIGQTLFTSSSYASSISGVILNNGAITNTGTITSTGVMTLSNSSTTAFQVRDGSNNARLSVDTIGGIVSVSSSTASTNTSTGALVVSGGLGVSGDLFVCSIPNSRLSVMHSSGDEGGEIFLNKPVTNTAINTGLTIDIYQNRLRFFEAGGSNRGFYLDIPSGGNSVGTNLLGGGSGTVSTLTAGTGISFSTGATITTTGTIRARRPLVASFCAGYTPAASGADSVVIRLPDSPSDGTTAITYEPQEFHIRVETASATTTTIQLEKYTGTGAFSGTAITSVSISGGSTYEAQTSVFAGAGIFLTSGDKLRINFTALSASHANFSVYLELEEV